MFPGFSEVTVKNQDGTDAIEAVTGLKCKRRCDGFFPNGTRRVLIVYYTQWLVGVNGEIKDSEDKTYYIYDSPDIYYSTREIKTPATYYVAGEDMGGGVLAVGGEVKTPAIKYDGTEIKIPAKFNFTYWARTLKISQEMVGKCFEELFVEAQINPRLQILPIDVKKNYDNT